MATRLNYALPVARNLARDSLRRLRSGSLAGVLREPPPAGRQFVVVCGPGRSGTSAVARVLHESGIPMGVEFLDASVHNEVGFYEDVGLVAVNEAILSELGLFRVRRHRSWPWRSTVLAVAARHGEAMARVAATARGGWKDPLLSVTLEAWLPLMPHRPRLIICLRSPRAFLHSVTRIFGLVLPEDVEAMWEHEMRRTLAVMRDYQLPATVVEYDRLLRDPATVVAELSEFVGRPLDPQYIRPELARFHHTVPPRLRPLYEEIRALSPGAHEPLDYGEPPPEGATDGETPSTEGYLDYVRDAVARVAEAKAACIATTGLPDVQPGASETRDACASYVGEVSALQEEVGALRPPDALARYHELTRALVNNERITAQVALQVVDGKRPPDLLREAWEKCSAPDVVAGLERQREEALSQALAGAG